MFTVSFFIVFTDLHCCDDAPTDTCKHACRTLLQTEVTEQAIVDGLVQACGDVKPHEPMWRCFFFGQATEEEQPSLSSPWVLKRQCCQRAVSDNCRRLCNLVHTRPWEGPQRWDQFERHCDYGSSNEIELNQCLQEGESYNKEQLFKDCKYIFSLSAWWIHWEYLSPEILSLMVLQSS